MVPQSKWPSILAFVVSVQILRYKNGFYFSCYIELKVSGGVSIICWGLSHLFRNSNYMNFYPILRLTKSDFREPVNIGSDEMVSMNEMAEIVLSFDEKKLPIHHIPGPEGVRGRNSDNTLIKEKLGWAPSMKLKVTLSSFSCSSTSILFEIRHVTHARHLHRMD